MTLTNSNFSLFDVNIQCLMRQEVQLLSESFKKGFFFFFFHFSFLSLYIYIYICQGIHPTSHPTSPKTLKNTQSGSFIIPHKLYALACDSLD
jgi:hypothetical protein